MLITNRSSLPGAGAPLTVLTVIGAALLGVLVGIALGVAYWIRFIWFLVLFLTEPHDIPGVYQGRRD